MTSSNQRMFPIVGAHFRPPAKQLLVALPGGATLWMQDEPDNPYDPAAIRVMVHAASQVPDNADSHAALVFALEGTGHDIADVMAEDLTQLGFIAASEGKPLAAVGQGEGNAEFRQMMTEWGLEWPVAGQLGFLPSSHPVVVVTKPEELQMQALDHQIRAAETWDS